MESITSQALRHFFERLGESLPAPANFYLQESGIHFRWRGQFDFSKGGQAVDYGVFMVVSGFITVLIIFIIPAHLFFSF